MTGPRILIWDLENLPGLGYFWGGTYNTNIIEVKEPSRVMCFAAKWRGEKKVTFLSTFHDGREAMLQEASALLDEADAAVTYNGARHDSPHIHTEFVQEGVALPSPYREIDLYKVVKRKLKFHSNKLSSVSHQLGLRQKVTHEGFPLWLACMAGDEKAWNRMRRYNIGDLKPTEDVYDTVLPLIPGSMQPNWNLFTGEDEHRCPSCGSRDVQRRGLARTSMSVFQRWQCQGCGSWSKSARRESGTDLRAAV